MRASSKAPADDEARCEPPRTPIAEPAARRSRLEATVDGLALPQLGPQAGRRRPGHDPVHRPRLLRLVQRARPSRASRSRRSPSPTGTYLLTQQLGTVDIRYRIATDPPASVTAESFAVTIDLATYDMTQAPQVPVAADPRPPGDRWARRCSPTRPTRVSVALDRLDEAQVRVAVDSGVVPPGLEIGTPQLSVAAGHRQRAAEPAAIASTAPWPRCASIRRGSTAAGRSTSCRSTSTGVAWSRWS